MNREEFLKQLQEALVGRVPDQVVQENIIYYRRYISEQISGGKSEPEVLRMLGDPRLLAKTIEGTSKFATITIKIKGARNTKTRNASVRIKTKTTSTIQRTAHNGIRNCLVFLPCSYP